MLEVKKIVVGYGEKPVLKSISFNVNRGERVVVVGESGCGKTTLLKTIAGYVQPSSGGTYLDGAKVKGPSEQLVPGNPKIKLVNQDFGLDDFHTIEENIRLKLLAFDTEYISYRIETLLQVTGLEKLRHQPAHQLSGGQKQRLAIARALADEPEVLLLDEPFNQLDFFLRQKIENYIDNYLKKYNITLIMVSHNAEETMRWGEKVIFMNSGKITRIDTPTSFYNFPGNKKEAGFFGVVNTVFLNGKYLSFRPHDYSLQMNSEYPEKINVDLLKVIDKGWYFDHLVLYKRKVVHLYSNKKIEKFNTVYFKPLF